MKRINVLCLIWFEICRSTYLVVDWKWIFLELKSREQRHRGLKLTDTNPSSGLVLFFFILAWKANHQREMVNENFSQSYFLWHCQGGIQILIHSFKSVFMKLINFLISLRMGIFFFLFRVISWFHWIFFFTKQPNSLGSWK